MKGKLSLREKRLAAVLAVMAAVMVFYQFIWQVQYPRYLTLRQNLQMETAKLDQALKTAASLQQVESRRLDIDARWAATQVHFTTDLKGGIPIIEMGRRLDGVELIGVYPGEIIEKESYMVLPLDLKVRGTYVEILGFIQSLESLPQAMSIQALGMTTGGETGASAGNTPMADATQGVVTTDMKLAFYGSKEGPVARLGGDWAVGRFDIFSPALQDLLDAARNLPEAEVKPPVKPKPQTQPRPAPVSGSKDTPAAVRPREVELENIYRFRVK